MREEIKAYTDTKKRDKKPPTVRGFATPQAKGKANLRNGMYLNADIGDELFYSECDPNGSYTGITRDGDNRPVQDADDL